MTNPQRESNDTANRLLLEEQFVSYQYGYIIQSHINRIGEVIMETNEHNRYVREVLHRHLVPGGYYRISDINDRRIIHYAYAICSVAWDEYNKLTVSMHPLRKNNNTETSFILDAQRDMLQSVLELLEKDVKTALYHMK